MGLLDRLDLPELRETLRARGLDGWFLYDFHGVNPVAGRVIGHAGMVTRRVFIMLPAIGEPRAVIHRIDHPIFSDFPGTMDVYTTWEELHHYLGALVHGRRIAMEVSLENGVPYLDRVPAGAIELLRRLGATIVPSASLVTQFAARWSERELVQHREVAESLAGIARTTVARTVREVGNASELAVQQELIGAIERAGWTLEDPPIVAFGPHAADPHFAPQASREDRLGAGQVVLIDLWARHSPDGMWADQTWMGFAGSDVPDEMARAWSAVKEARDTVVSSLRDSREGGLTLTGADLDRRAREVIGRYGLLEACAHRTGHSIDFDLHGSGPHLDDTETHDTRELLPGVGFSVEPGVYFPRRFGMRSEINVHLASGGPEVTPKEPQQALILAG